MCRGPGGSLSLVPGQCPHLECEIDLMEFRGSRRSLVQGSLGSPGLYMHVAPAGTLPEGVGFYPPGPSA